MPFTQPLWTILLLLSAWTSLLSGNAGAAGNEETPVADVDNWQDAVNAGDYDHAVFLSLVGQQSGNPQNNDLTALIRAARELKLAQRPQWRTFLHYKPKLGGRWLSQVDAPHFFMSDSGKSDPEAELNATLAALFSINPKPPLRLTAYCRFVARRHWLTEQLGNNSTIIPDRQCPEFDRYVDYLQADTLTLIFPTAHPNSPSSAFGHTLLRIDKKDQRPESRLLNMSINFAAEVPEDVSSAAYAIRGLSGGFLGKFRMLPYHMKLREYGQIENRDTWEYPLELTQSQVDLVLRHSYEMLISHFDYFFFSENCSYHLLSLLEVANPGFSLTDEFNWWTIPVDTIRLLNAKGLNTTRQFVPSSIRTLRARRANLSDSEGQLALSAHENGVDSIATKLKTLDTQSQAAVLDLLSDYERYVRLETDPSAQGSSATEKSILSLRSKLGVKSEVPKVPEPSDPPNAGHGTARVGIEYQHMDEGSDIVEITLRPAYHDFRDPSAGFDDKAAIELGLAAIGYDIDNDKPFLRRLKLVSIESIEPRGEFFKPVSWHTNLDWQRNTPDSRHEFTFNVGAGAAFQTSANAPVIFAFGESDLVDAPAFNKRQQLRLGASVGTHWEPVRGLRTGLELDYRKQVGGPYYQAQAELWFGIAVQENLSLNIDVQLLKKPSLNTITNTRAGIRFYF